MAFPTKISTPFFQFGRVLQPGWGEMSLGERSVKISGKAPASGVTAVFAGALLASALAGKKTLSIRYGDILNVSAGGKKLTLEYKNEKGKKKRLFLMPFREKGFLGGKDPQAQDLAEQIEERCAG